MTTDFKAAFERELKRADKLEHIVKSQGVTIASLIRQVRELVEASEQKKRGAA